MEYITLSYLNFNRQLKPSFNSFEIFLHTFVILDFKSINYISTTLNQKYSNSSKQKPRSLQKSKHRQFPIKNYFYFFYISNLLDIFWPRLINIIFYSHILSTNKITSMATELLPMTEEHTQEVADLLTRNFLNNNPIWKSFNLDNQQVFKFFINEIRLHLDSETTIRQTIDPNIAFNMVYFHEGKIIAAGFNFELHEYLKVSSLPGESETLKHFQVLQNYGKKLFDSLKIEQHQKGRHIYGSFIVIDQNVDKEVKKAFRNKAIMSTYKKFIDQGFKSLILRTSHIGSQKIYLSLGAKIVSEVEFELKGQNLQLKLLKLEFDNPIFSKMLGL